MVLQFTGVVKISQTSEEFIRLCGEAARSPDQARIKRGKMLSERNSWESIVEAMEGHIADALERDCPWLPAGRRDCR